MPLQTFADAAGPAGPLKGAMLSPDVKQAPVVLIIPGFGKADRDGNSPQGPEAASLRHLAEGFAVDGHIRIGRQRPGQFGA